MHNRRLIILLLAAIFPGQSLFAQAPKPDIKIVLQLRNPAGQPINNILLPEFSFHFENPSDQFGMIETAPNSIVKTERLRYLLTSPDGTKHFVSPPVELHRPHDDGSNLTVLHAGESTKRVRHSIQQTLQEHFWDWWQDLLWAPGKYALAIVFVPDKNKEYGNPLILHDTLYSNTVEFEITQTPEYLPIPPHSKKINKGLLRGKRNGERFHHIRYANEQGDITAERIYTLQENSSIEPAFEIVYDHPIPSSDTINWRIVHQEILNGHGSQYIPFWHPTVPNEKANGQVRTWNFRESYIRKARPLADAQYRNGVLEGPLEVYIDGRHIAAQFVNGQKDGVWAVWRDTTVIYRAEFKEGKKHGDYFMMHYSSTIPWEIGTYENGVRHGVFESFHENGQLKEHLEYEHDTLSGIGVWYDEEGKELAKGMYLHGKPYNGTFFLLRPGLAGGYHGRIRPQEPVKYREGILQTDE